MRFPRLPVLLTAGLLALALSVARAPAAAHDDDDVPSVANTTWVGPDGEDVMTMYFERGGVLAYSYANGTYRNGTWKQTGKKLYLEMNKKYREFEGTISGDTIRGHSWNVKDKEWKTTLYRVRKVKTDE